MPNTYRSLVNAAKGEIVTISLEDLKGRLEAGDVEHLIDVRETSEFEGGTIPSARNIPRGVLESEIERVVPNRDQKLIVFCGGGGRAALAAKTLAELGYAVEAVDPGFRQWKELGFPCGSVRATEPVPAAQSGHAREPRETTLHPRDLERYSRQIRLREIGESGQLRLKRGRVLILGAGGLGSSAALYLAAAGVGTIGLVDSDAVELSNLHRQILHGEKSLGSPKVESATRRLTELNSEISVHALKLRLGKENAVDILSDYDVIVDASDNFATRYIVNDVSVRLGLPIVHGSLFHFEGQATTFAPHSAGEAHSPCYRCLFPAPPSAAIGQTCAEAGVLGALCGVIGSIQATEALKVLLGLGETLAGRLLTYDALRMQFRELAFERDLACSACGDVRA